MPITLPRYDERMIQERGISVVKQNPSADLEAFGGGKVIDNFNTGMDKLSTSLRSIADIEIKNANEVATLKTKNDLNALQNKLSIYATQQKGENAITKKHDNDNKLDLFGYVEDEWKKGTEEILSGLSNDNQKMSGRIQAEAHWNDLNKSLQMHIAGERKQFDKDQFTTALANSLDAGIRKYNDPAEVTKAAIEQQAMIRDYGRRNGLSNEQQQLLSKENNSKLLSEVIHRHLNNGNDITAKEFYDDFKDAIHGEDLIKLDKALEEGSTRGQSQRMADKITSIKDINRLDAMAKVKEIRDPKLRDATEERVNKYFSEVHAAKEQIKEENFLSALKTVKGNPHTPIKDLVTPGIYSQLSDSQQKALERARIDVPNDDKTYLGFISMGQKALAAIPPAQFYEKYWTKFDAENKNKAESMWQSAIQAENSGKLDPKLTSTISFHDQVIGALRSSKVINPTKEQSKWNDEEVRLVADFTLQAAKNLENYELNELGGKRKATKEEIDKIIDPMLIKVHVAKPGFFTPDKKTVIGLTPREDLKDVYVKYKDIPEEEIRALENRIKLINSRIADPKQHRRITKDKIERAYRAFGLRDKASMLKILEE